MTTWIDKGGRKWGGGRGERTEGEQEGKSKRWGKTHFEKLKDMKTKSFIISRVRLATGELRPSPAPDEML